MPKSCYHLGLEVEGQAEDWQMGFTLRSLLLPLNSTQPRYNLPECLLFVLEKSDAVDNDTLSQIRDIHI